jgi:hypothetical protein
MRASAPLLWTAGMIAAAIVAIESPATAEDGRLGARPWFPAVDPETPPQETLEQHRVGIIRVGDHDWRANRGPYRAQLSRRDFYFTVGRADLATRLDDAQRWSAILFWSGATVTAVGVGLVYAHSADGGIEPELRTGLIVMGGGLAVMLSSTFVREPDVPADEALDMAGRYNESLKLHIERELGLPKAKPVHAAAPRIAPWTDGRSGGGIVMLMAF